MWTTLLIFVLCSSCWVWIPELPLFCCVTNGVNDIRVTFLSLTFLICTVERMILASGGLKGTRQINSKDSMTHDKCSVSASYYLYYYSPGSDKAASLQVLPSAYSHQLEDAGSRYLVTQKGPLGGQGPIKENKGSEWEFREKQAFL